MTSFSNLAMSSLFALAATGSELDVTVELINSNFPWEGIVKVCKDGECGFVCDNRFGTLDAAVVCGQVGFE